MNRHDLVHPDSADRDVLADRETAAEAQHFLASLTRGGRAS
jgi:hypothetical protein